MNAVWTEDVFICSLCAMCLSTDQYIIVSNEWNKMYVLARLLVIGTSPYY